MTDARTEDGSRQGRWRSSPPRAWATCKYRVSNAVAEKPWLIAIAIFFAVLVVASVLGAAVGFASRSDEHGPAWHAWEFVGRTFGADELKETVHWWVGAGLVCATLMGVVFVGTVAGSATEGINRWMRRIQRGRLPVLEHDHTVIVGWSPNTVLILNELIEANRSEGGKPIVVLAEADKAEMDQELRERIPRRARHGSAIITRTGSGSGKDDLRIVAADRARALVILPPGRAGIDRAIACVAAMTSYPPVAARLAERDGDGRPGLTVVAPVGGESERRALQEIDIGKGAWIPHRRIMSRLIAHAIRGSGLGAAHEQLLSFSGDELYLWPTAERRKGARRPALRQSEEGGIADVVGLTFLQAQHGYELGCLLGIRCSDGVVTLNPPYDRVIGPGDQLVVVARDNSPEHIRFERSLVPAAAPIQGYARRKIAKPRMNVLVLGVGPITSPAVEQLDEYLAPGSTIRAVTSSRAAMEGIVATMDGLKHCTGSCRLVPELGLSALRAELSAGTDAVMIFPDDPGEDPHHADMGTVRRLLQVRAAIRELGLRTRVVTEVLDDRNLGLVEVASPDDAVVSDKIASLYCLQVSQEPHLEWIFGELLDTAGLELAMMPALDLLEPGREVDFHDVIDAAASVGATAIGYRAAEDAARRDGTSGVRFNPPKSRRFVPQPGDFVIAAADC